MAAPTIRPGFPVVASNSGAAAPYDVTTDVFSANYGDELTAIVMGGCLPTVVSRNAGNTSSGTLKWLRRFVTRVCFTDTSTNVGGAQQVAIYTAIVPPGGVTERARFTTTTTANDGGQTLSPNNLPARLAVIAVDNTNGVGAVGWKGSIQAGSGGSNDVTAGQPATQTIKPFGTGSLIIGGGWFVNGSAPQAIGGCNLLVDAGSNRMPIWTRIGGEAGVDVAIGSSITDSTLWALGMVEYLPTTTPKPIHKLFCFGDSGIESTNSARQTAVVVQDALAPNWELFDYGVWWAHTDQTLSRWNADSPNYPQMHAAIVQVGINDVTQNSAWNSTSQSNLASIYSGLSALGVPLACYTGIGPLATPGVAPAEYYEFRDWVTANAPAGKHLYSLDLVGDPGAGYLGILPAYLAADGGHVDAAGNAITGADISAWINTLPLISISAHPPSAVQVNAGAAATFNVTAAGGSPPLSYQWRKNGSNISGATSASYTTPPATYSDQGARFDCVITDNNSQTVTSSPATLRVAFNLSGTGPRAFPSLGAVLGGGTVDAQLRAPAAAGGLSAAVTEAASASDSSTATIVTAAARAEAASAVDSPAAALQTSAALTEPASATEAAAGQNATTASAVEASAAADSGSASATAAATITEPASAADSSTAAASGNAATVTETASAGDAQAATAAMAAAISEPSSADASAGAVLAAIAAAAEAAAAGDAATAVATLVAAATEPASASEASAGTVSTPNSAAITEPASAGDSSSSVATRAAAVAEAGAATDDAAATKSTAAAQSEAGAAADAQTAARTQPADRTEAAAAAESSSSGVSSPAAVVEVSAAGDSCAALAARLASIVEAAAAQDLVLTGGLISTGVAEAASAADFVAWLRVALPGDARVFTIASQGRTLTVTAELRRLGVAAELRSITISAQTRDRSI